MIVRRLAGEMSARGSERSAREPLDGSPARPASVWRRIADGVVTAIVVGGWGGLLAAWVLLAFGLLGEKTP